MKKIIYIFILFFGFHSCHTTWEIDKNTKQQFTYRYDGKYSGLDTIINIKGYYQQTILYKRSKKAGDFLKDTSVYEIDTIFYFLIFYDNGLCRINFDDFARQYNDNMDFIQLQTHWYPRNIPLFFQKIKKDLNAPYSLSFYNDRWGVYRIFGDTIKIQALHERISLNDGWYIIKQQYKIIDMNTIQEIYTKNENMLYVNHAVFLPTSEQPLPLYTWLLQYKWFWKNASEWEQYMRKETNDR
ncbi:MAG: hypothetical protein LBR36_09990 [Bacteroidales bacterium]|jgi:hypothetical protein|nr:hypothetical protein [Bacteroidales bacterium]